MTRSSPPSGDDEARVLASALASPAGPGGPGGSAALRVCTAVVLDALDAGVAARLGPLPAGGPAAVAARTRRALGLGPGQHGLLPEYGVGAAAALAGLTEALAAGAADPADPACAAHLHCPPLAVAVAADLAVSALNPSLDSWDQAPSATTVETEVLATLAGLVGYDPARSTGTMTTGGTASNLTGLLLAREQAAAARDAAAARAARATPTAAAPRSAGRLRVFCSDVSHFSVRRSARLLGLGDDAIVTVGCDDRHRMDPAALRRALDGHDGPAVVVATAGTTDAGAVDPLPAVVEATRASRPARSASTWIHVDAAYGGGALFSDRLRGLLDGIDQADSVALDLHKLGWQPVPAGVVLTREAQPWDRLDTEVAYLNPADDTAAGFSSLLGRSLQTTRRSDAFAVAATFQALGRRRLGELVDACHDLARYAAASIERCPSFELALPVTLTSVVFRYMPRGSAAAAGLPGRPRIVDEVNAELRRRLTTSGRGLVGRTELGSGAAVHLKLTLLNPHASAADVDALLDLVVAAGDAVIHDLRRSARTSQSPARPRFVR